MKILGVTPMPYANDEYIVSITAKEIEKITGVKQFKSGDEICVTKSFDRLAAIDAQKEQRNKVAAQLRAMAELVELIPQIVIEALDALIDAEKEATR